MTGFLSSAKVILPADSEQGLDKNSTKKRKGYWIFLSAALMCTFFITALVILCGIYLGHTITKDTYEKAKLSYLKDGFLVYETVSVEEDQVDFESEEGVSVIFDYNKMLAVIKTSSDADGACFVIRLIPALMGTYNDIKRLVQEGSHPRVPTEIQFTNTNRTVDGAILSSRASALCANLSTLWLEMQSNEDSSLHVRGKRNSQRLTTTTRPGKRHSQRWTTTRPRQPIQKCKQRVGTIIVVIHCTQAEKKQMKCPCNKD